MTYFVAVEVATGRIIREHTRRAVIRQWVTYSNHAAGFLKYRLEERTR
jgi:hypothetical protein